MSRFNPKARGYILLETVMALVVLSIGALTINGAARNALQTRGQALDYTDARFILDNLMADVEMQPRLQEGVTRGAWKANPRFQWRIEIRKAPLTPPVTPRRPGPKSKPPGSFKFDAHTDYLTAVEVTLSWTRGGQSFEESYETLLPPDRLKEPEVEVQP
jgi:hypothetical protein